MSTTAPASSSSTNPPDTHGLTKLQYDTLISKAVAAQALAYCPYSNFPVGASVLATDPSADSSYYIPGANLENASSPVGICAERAALTKALIEGHRTFLALAVATNAHPVPEGRGVDGGGNSPCGMCRQFMHEFLGKDIPVFMVDGAGNVVVKTVGQLLPWGFGRGALESGRGKGSAKESGGVKD